MQPLPVAVLRSKRSLWNAAVPLPPAISPRCPAPGHRSAGTLDLLGVRLPEPLAEAPGIALMPWGCECWGSRLGVVPVGPSLQGAVWLGLMLFGLPPRSSLSPLCPSNWERLCFEKAPSVSVSSVLVRGWSTDPSWLPVATTLTTEAGKITAAVPFPWLQQAG